MGVNRRLSRIKLFFKTSKYRYVTGVFCLLLVLVSLRLIYYSVSQGFCLERIENNLPVSDRWKLPEPNQQQLALLTEVSKQRFYYLAKGSQAYAFISEDGNYILKFVKCYHMQSLDWLNKWPFWGPFNGWKQANIERRKRKIAETLISYRLAYERIPEESALLFIQMQPSSLVNHSVTVQDRLGRVYTIDLSKSAFILQKKADLIFPKLTTWIETQQLDKAKSALRSLIKIIVDRSLKHVHDSDPDLHKNAGLIGEQAVFIDVGSFHDHADANDPAVMEFHLRKTTRKLCDWLKVKNTDLANYMERQIDIALAEASGSPSNNE